MNVRDLREHLMDFEDDTLVLMSLDWGYREVTWIDLEEGLTKREDQDTEINAVVIGG